MLFEPGTVEPKPFVPNNARRRTLRATDGKLFVGKNDHCRKSRGNRNTAWLVNEIVAAQYAVSAGLRVPDLRLLTAEGREYLGSEFLPGRLPLRAGNVTKLFGCDNQTQLTRALLLDLALLNSDRTAGEHSGGCHQPAVVLRLRQGPLGRRAGRVGCFASVGIGISPRPGIAEPG
jgi:hypothetical protein